MEDAKAAIRQVLTETKAFLAQEAPPKLTEADTKAHFIDPLLAALGWRGIGIVVREYYVRESQEFIDYVMFGPGGPVFAVEAKSLQTAITEKHAAQLIQYCSIEGIEWAAVTNGREIHLFNTFLKPDLSAKRVLMMDLLAPSNDEEFDTLFDDMRFLSREQMLSPTGTRAWLQRRRLDAAIREIILNPQSATVRQLRRELADAEISSLPQDIVHWFGHLLGTPSSALTPARMAASISDRKAVSRPRVAGVGSPPSDTTPLRRSSTPHELFAGRHEALREVFEELRRSISQRWPQTEWRDLKQYIAALAEGQTFLAVYPRAGGLVMGLSLPKEATHERLADNQREFHWTRITKIAHVSSAGEIDESLLQLIESARNYASDLRRTNSYFGITLRDLIAAQLLRPHTRLSFRAARAMLRQQRSPNRASSFGKTRAIARSRIACLPTFSDGAR